MDNTSLYLLAKKLEAQLKSILSNSDAHSLNKETKARVASLKRGIVDMRLDVRDYELSETLQQRAKNSQSGQERLETLRQDILAVSEYNLFSPVDVAQLLAYLDLLQEYLASASTYVSKRAN